jgi:competence protein ComEC
MTSTGLKRKLTKLSFIAILIVIPSNILVWTSIISSQSRMGLLEIIFLDVGQGDSILIKTPNNKFGLIDTGPNSTVMEELDDYLPIGVNSLEFIIVTHIDSDHAEGLLSILTKYEVKNLFINKFNKRSDFTEEILNIIKEKNIYNMGISDKNDFHLDGVSFDVLWPIHINSTNTLDTNNQSIAIKLTFGELDVFLGGDLESEYENKAISNINAREIDVLKASHHGSKTSSNRKFLQELAPIITIISAGINNRYGHPHEEILNNIRSINSHVYRTDIDKSIKIISDGLSINIRTGKGTEAFYEL